MSEIKEPNKSEPIRDPYVEVGNYLWRQVDSLSIDDKDAIHDYDAIIYELEPLFDEHLPRGYMLELRLWCGLKDDTPEMAKDYGEGIKKDFPELFPVV